MQISIGSPEFPRPHRPRSGSYELVAALRSHPTGWWLNVDLDSLPGATVTTKQNSTARALRRHLRPIQTQVEGSQLFVRHVPDPKLPCVAQPIDWTNRARPVFFRPPQGNLRPPE